MPNNKILFIVEGINDEVSFVRRLLKKCSGSTGYEIYPYRCNIHVLAQLLYNDYPDFENDEIDIQLVLRSLEDDKEQKKLLGEKYRDIFMIFDFDPHHDVPHFDTVKRMLDYFNDSSDRGKLYINYPMMQSYKHFPCLPDDSFRGRTVSLQNCMEYKRIVGQESRFTDINQYDYFIFMSLLFHHICKANFILTGKYELPDVEEYLNWKSIDLFNLQVERVKSEEEIFVLNTCIFILADFAPERFFRTITKKKNEFYINGSLKQIY